MTKLVRIENADACIAEKLKVEVWDITAYEEFLVEVHYLDHPAQMTNIYLWGNRFIKVMLHE